MPEPKMSTKRIHRENFDGSYIYYTVRYNNDTNHIGVEQGFRSMAVDNKDSLKWVSNNYDKYIAHKRKYNRENRENLNEIAREQRRNKPSVHFFEHRFELKEHKRAPKGYVWHHTCYDHADPEANIVLLSIRTHLMGHQLLKKLGIEIPHINEER